MHCRRRSPRPPCPCWPAANSVVAAPLVQEMWSHPRTSLLASRKFCRCSTPGAGDLITPAHARLAVPPPPRERGIRARGGGGGGAHEFDTPIRTPGVAFAETNSSAMGNHVEAQGAHVLIEHGRLPYSPLFCHVLPRKMWLSRATRERSSTVAGAFDTPPSVFRRTLLAHPQLAHAFDTRKQQYTILPNRNDSSWSGGIDAMLAALPG
eukprot:COSAG05_NODE_2225_length_3368_cov_45.242861_1_plen_208_part_00